MHLITCNGFKYNYNKWVHGVTFEEAGSCIFSAYAVATEDTAHSQAERRIKLVALSDRNRILTVIYCKRIHTPFVETRIISARPAGRDKKIFEEKFGRNVLYSGIPVALVKKTSFLIELTLWLLRKIGELFRVEER